MGKIIDFKKKTRYLSLSMKVKAALCNLAELRKSLLGIKEAIEPSPKNTVKFESRHGTARTPSKK